MVPFFSRNFSQASIDRVLAVISSGFLTSGQVGRSVEAQLAEYFDTRCSALVSSWTAAWDIVLDFHDIGPGDEVIMPSVTFVSCANSVVRRGASVIFCDIDPETLVASIETIAPKVTDKTKLILVVHLYGLMADISAIRCAFPSLAIYEDAAHCFEGKFNGCRPGKFSDGAMFSFYATKNISCGEGGALITNNESLDGFCKTQRLHGMNKTAIDRYQSKNYTHWDVHRPGYKFNLPDILSALLPEQIERADNELAWRHKLYNQYVSALDHLIIDGLVRVQKIPLNVTHAHHLFPICVNAEQRDELLTWLTSHNIGVAVNFRDIPSLEYYKSHARPNVAREWGDGTISLPFHRNVSLEDVEFICDTIHQFFME